MKNSSVPVQAAEFINAKSSGFKPKIAIILGSGLGQFARNVQNAIHIPYEEIPGFIHPSVPGHPGILSLGTINDVPVACLQGRLHFYEGHTAAALQIPIRTLRLLGCEILLNTTAVGSLQALMKPGSLVVINDHINFQFNNPLVGKNDDSFGPRFISMENAYDADLRQRFLKLGADLNIPLQEGVYVGVLGPSYETPAEIRAFRILGADVVGMSAVAEVILARHCGLKVTLISVVTNFAAGLNVEEINHAEVIKVAAEASEKLAKLLGEFVGSLKHG